MLISGKYELLEVAGSGGMATVWRATQRGAAGFNRTVAIKRIKEAFIHDESFVAMFVEEARVASALVHPNVVQIYDFGEYQGRYFLVMEWIEGICLSKYLQVMQELGQLPPWHLVATVVVEALRGLTAAHDRRDAQDQPAPVYHRDVTPQNILMGTNGIVKLTDFGLARAMDRGRMTAPDIVKGKVGYLAPEMTQRKAPSPQTDIYAVGVVMWQALAGCRLFEGKDDIEIFLAASRGEIQPIGELRPDVPPRFAAIVERALARDPVDRFTSAAQMERVIVNLLRSATEVAGPKLVGRCVSDVNSFVKTGRYPAR